MLEDGSGVEYDATDVIERQQSLTLNETLRDESIHQEYDLDLSRNKADREIHDIPTPRQTQTEAINQYDQWNVTHASQYEAAAFATPASIGELTRRYEEGIFAFPTTPITPLAVGGSNVTSPAASLPTPGANPRPKLSRREAFLMHHFVHKIAPWVCHDLNI